MVVLCDGQPGSGGGREGCHQGGSGRGGGDDGPVADAELGGQPEQAVHPLDLELVDELAVELVLDEGQAVRDLLGVVLPFQVLFQPEHFGLQQAASACKRRISNYTPWLGKSATRRKVLSNS